MLPPKESPSAYSVLSSSVLRSTGFAATEQAPIAINEIATTVRARKPANRCHGPRILHLLGADTLASKRLPRPSPGPAPRAARHRPGAPGGRAIIALPSDASRRD